MQKSRQKSEKNSLKTGETVFVSVGNKRRKILQLIDTVGNINNTLIYDVEFKPSLVRVYIDSEKDYTDLNSCETFMKSLLFLLESEGMKDMECEVSSPGLERKLKKNWHFQAAIGKNVKVHTSQPVFCYDEKSEKKRKKTTLTGFLHKYQDNVINVRDGFLEWIIPLNIITKANIVFGTKK